MVDTSSRFPVASFRYWAIKGQDPSAVKVKQYQFVWDQTPNSWLFFHIFPCFYYTRRPSISHLHPFWTWFPLWEFDIMRKKRKGDLSWRLDFQNRWFRTNSLRNFHVFPDPQVTLPDDKKNETAGENSRRILTNEFLPTVANQCPSGWSDFSFWLWLALSFVLIEYHFRAIDVYITLKTFTELLPKINGRIYLGPWLATFLPVSVWYRPHHQSLFREEGA